MSVNPFRFRKQKWQNSPLLLHAILALCCQHLDHTSKGVWTQQAAEHLQQATLLLESASFHDMPTGHNDLYLLDPILVMFTLDVGFEFAAMCWKYTLLNNLAVHTFSLRQVEPTSGTRATSS